MLNINVDCPDAVLFVKDSEVRPSVIAKVAHIGTDIQEMADCVDEPIRDLGDTAALPSALDELSFLLKDAKHFAEFNSFPI